MRISAPSFGIAWYDLLWHLYHHGKSVSPRGFETHEIIGVQFRVTDLKKNILVSPERNPSYRFMIAEWAWMSAGREDVATVAKYNKNIAQFSDDGIKFNGAYGPRVAGQMDWLMDQLVKPGSRQAVVQIWTPTPSPSKDIPCTTSWQLLARDGKLNAIVTMRSSDIHLGMPYDFFNFSMLTNELAGILGLDTGELIFNLGSSHLYDRDRLKAEAVLNAASNLYTISSPPLPGKAPANGILDDVNHLETPWSVYRDVLKALTNADARSILETLR